MRKNGQDFASWLVAWLSKDPTTQANLASLVAWIMKRKDTQQATVDLVKRVLEDPVTRQQTAHLAAEIMKFDVVREQSVQLGIYTSHEVLNNQDVKEHTTQFFETCLSDPDLQQTAGNAIWNAVSYSVTPQFRFSWSRKTSNAEPVALGETQPSN